jgi:hypothetical protein
VSVIPPGISVLENHGLIIQTLVNFIERTVNYEFNRLGGAGQTKELMLVITKLIIKKLIEI